MMMVTVFDDVDGDYDEEEVRSENYNMNYWRGVAKLARCRSAPLDVAFETVKILKKTPTSKVLSCISCY